MQFAPRIVKTQLKFYNPKAEMVKRLNYYSSKRNPKRISLSLSSATSTDHLKTATIINSLKQIEESYPNIKSSFNNNSTYNGTSNKFSKYKNILIESELIQQLKYKTQQMERIKKEKNDKILSLRQLQEKLDELNSDIEIISIMTKSKGKFRNNIILDKLDRIENISNKSNKVENKNKPKLNITCIKLKQRSLNIQNSAINIQSEFNDEKKKVYEKANTAKEIKNIIEKEKNSLNAIQEKYEKTQIEYSKIKQDLIIHYHSILKEGSDTRGEGLVWIIKAIYKLGKKVLISFLPDYLDDKSIQYLFLYSTLSIKLESIEKEIIEVIKLFQKLLNKTSEKKNVKIFHSTQNSPLRKTKIHSRNNSQFQKNFNVEDFYFNPNAKILKIETVDKILTEKKKIFSEHPEISEIVLHYEKLVNEKKELRDKMSQMKKNETHRIFIEFVKNDYERKYNIDKITVLSAILGEENLPSILTKQKKQLKEYYDTLKYCELHKMIMKKK